MQKTNLRKTWRRKLAGLLAGVLAAGVLGVGAVPMTAKAALEQPTDDTLVLDASGGDVYVGYTADSVGGTFLLNSNDDSMSTALNGAGVTTTANWFTPVISDSAWDINTNRDITVTAASGLTVGDYSDSMIITPANGNTWNNHAVTVTLTVKDAFTAPAITNGDFGTYIIGETDTSAVQKQSLTITNLSESAIKIQTPELDGFVFDGTFNTDIASNETFTFTVIPDYANLTAGKDYTNKKIVIPYTVNNLTYTDLSVEGPVVSVTAVAADYTLTPDKQKVDFGTTMLGTNPTAAAGVVEITNAGNVEQTLKVTAPAGYTAVWNGSTTDSVTVAEKTKGTLTIAPTSTTVNSEGDHNVDVVVTAKSANKENTATVTIPVTYKVVTAKRELVADKSETGLDFGETVNGTAPTKAMDTIKITNNGNLTETITVQPHEAFGFSETAPFDLNEKAYITITVTPKYNFDITADKTFNEPIRFTTSTGAEVTVPVTYKVLANTSDITGSTPGTLPFPEVAASYETTPEPLTVTIKNTGNTAATVKYAWGKDASATKYTVTPNSGFDVPAKGEKAVKVQPVYKQSIGDHDDTLTFYIGESLDKATSVFPVTVSFKVAEERFAVAVDKKTVQLKPLLTKFDTDMAKSIAEKITITNTGNAPITDLKIAAGENFTNAFILADGTKAAFGGNQKVTNLRPVSESADNKFEFYVYPDQSWHQNEAGTSATYNTAKVTISSAQIGNKLEGDKEISVDFSTEGKAANKTELYIREPVLDEAGNPTGTTKDIDITSSKKVEFDSLIAGYAHADVADKTVVIKNTGNAKIAVNQVKGTLTKFTVPNNYPQTIQPGGEASFKIQPNDDLPWNANPYEEKISIWFSEKGDQNYDINDLTFSVKVEKQTWGITADPMELDFEKQETTYNSDSLAKEVVITNSGNQTIVLNEASLKATGFEVSFKDQKSTATIKKGETSTLVIKPVVKEIGDHSTTMTIKTNDSTVSKDISLKLVVDTFYKVNARTADSNGTAKAEKDKAAKGDSVAIEATPKSGYNFVKWEVRGEGAKIANAKAAKTTVTVGTADVEVTAVFEKQTNKISVNPATAAFGKIVTGAAAPAKKTVTVKNDGNVKVKLTQPTSTGFTIGKLSATELEPGKTATFTIVPKDVKTVKKYNEKISVKGEGNATATVTATFEVEKKADPVVDFVTRAYSQILQRTPDAQGLNDWVTRLKNKEIGGGEMIAQFLESKEYKNRKLSTDKTLEVLYASFMDRKPDAAGKQHWTTQLNSGKSVRDVAAEFTSSKEFKNICARYGINPGTVNSGSGSGTTETGVKGFVERCYKEALGRAGDTQGVNDWVNRITKKEKTPAAVAKEFVFSKEMNNKNLNNEQYIKMLYRLCMGRDFDQSGLNHWLGEMSKGKTKEQVFQEFVTSKEFQNIVKSFGL